MLSRGLAFLVWAAVAACALYWGLRLFVTPPPAPAHATLALATPAATADLSRLLGADAPVVVEAAPAPAADARFQLLGVVAARNNSGSPEGVALIAVDGKPAKAYRVGAVVDGSQILQSVKARSAELGPRGGPAGVVLDLPPLPAASTGTLAAAAAPGVPPMPMPAPVRPPPVMQAPPNTRIPPRPFIQQGAVPGMTATLEGAVPAAPVPLNPRPGAVTQ